MSNYKNVKITESVNDCPHLNIIKLVKVGTTGLCEYCIRENTEWVHLRTCQECGITLCCDSSPEQHMSKHHNRIRHPVIASAEDSERWIYCYPDDIMAPY